MDTQVNGSVYDRDQMNKIEKEFRKKLLVLKAQGATNDEVSADVMRSPFILALVWAVTSFGYSQKLKGWRGSRPPKGWNGFLIRNDLRDEWQCETIYLLGKKCRQDGLLGCDLERPSIGGFWRIIVEDKAVKAAWKLFRENSNRLRRGNTPEEDVYINSSGDTLSIFADTRDDESHRDLELDVRMALESLEDPRQQAVVRLVLMGHSYREVAAILSEQTGEPVTYDMVRFAFEKAKAILGERDLGLAA